MSSSHRLILAPALAVALLLVGVGQLALAKDLRDTAANAATLEQFVKRAKGYVGLRDEATKDLPVVKESPSPTEVGARERALAAAIRAKRADAKRGDVFGAALEPITEIARRDWSKRTAAERAAFRGETPDVAPPRLNGAHPKELPIATFPPELLEALPELPKPLEYRFAGPHLVLHDVEADLVVDVAPDVLSDAVR